MNFNLHPIIIKMASSILVSIPELQELPKDGNSVSCQVIRGPTINGHRISLVIASVQSETLAPITTFFPPRYDMTGINILNIMADHQNLPKIRSVLTDASTPISDMEIKLHWNGDCYARSNCAYKSNDTGSFKPLQDVFQLASMIPPPHKENEVTVAFINQYPYAYNELDRVEIRENILRHEFEKLQSRHSTKHVYLYVHTPIFLVYSKLIMNFESYWKEVIPMESFFYFTNDFLGKNLNGVIQPSKSTLSVNTAFHSRFIFTESIHLQKPFDQIKPRNVSDTFKYLDFDTKSESAANSVIFCVEDQEETPFTNVTLNGIDNHMPFTKDSIATDIKMPHSDVLIETILLCEELKACKTHTEKKQWLSEHLVFKNSYELDCPLDVFTVMSHDSPFVSSMIRYARDILDHQLNDLFKEIQHTEFAMRRKKIIAPSQANLGNMPSMPPNPPKRPAFNSSPLEMTPTMSSR